jgi:hypothetical protein
MRPPTVGANPADARGADASHLDQSRHFDFGPGPLPVHPRSTDMLSVRRHVSKVPITEATKSIRSPRRKIRKSAIRSQKGLGRFDH